MEPSIPNNEVPKENGGLTALNGIATSNGSKDDDSDIVATESSVQFVKTDHYGFIYGSDHCGPQLSDKEMDKRKLQDATRTKKWLPMVINWSSYKSKHSNGLRSRVRKGIPDSVRGEIWMRLLETQAIKLNHSTFNYSTASVIPREQSFDIEIYDTIERDIDRTFPQHVVFTNSNSQGQNSLRSILHAYSEFDREVGYCQGMAFISGALLSYLDEEEAFWALTSICETPRLSCRQLFLPGMIRIQALLIIFGHLLSLHELRLHNHFYAIGLVPTMYATQWFLTLFSNIFPFDLVVNVWDIFFNEDWKIIFRVALALLRNSRNELLKCDFEGTMLYLRSFAHQVDGVEIIRLAFTIPLKRSQIDDASRLAETELECPPINWVWVPQS